MCATALSANRPLAESTCWPICHRKRRKRIRVKFVAKSSRLRATSRSTWQFTLAQRMLNVQFVLNLLLESLRSGNILVFIQVNDFGDRMPFYCVLLACWLFTDQRPKNHICELCTRAFSHRSSLWKHKKRPCLPLKPTEPAYECDMCATIFKGIIAQVQGKGAHLAFSLTN